MPGKKTSGKKPTAWTKPTSLTMPTAKKKSSGKKKSAAKKMPAGKPKPSAKKVGILAALAIARHPAGRKATAKAAKPTAKVGWKVGKVVAKRKARQKADQIGSAATTAAALWLIYGVPVAQELGLIERPKPRRTGRAFLAGVAIGGVAVYFIGPRRRGEHATTVAGASGKPG